MKIPDFMMIISSSQGLSVVLWIVIIMMLLYMARRPAHEAILSASKVLFHAFHLIAASIMLAEKRLKERNKEVLLAAGKEATERIIEREFERIDDYVKKDLAQFPTLQRDIRDNVVKIDEDYQKSTEIPPSPPGWTKAIEPIAAIPPSDDSMVVEILKSIRDTLEKGQQKALDAYRASSKMRHEYLNKMIPTLRQIHKSIGVLDKNVQVLLDRSATVDRHMDEYYEINKKSDKAAQMLSSSSLTQFFISGFVLAIAVGGAFINFNLIARPMQEMVGGSVYMMGFRVADIAALVIILVEISMGLFLMESMRITRLFPIIGALEDKIRIRMIIVSFVFLFLLASVESGLAYMRELLSADDAALVAGLLGGTAAEATEQSGRWITTAAQMGMGFILPFALAFIAIPLESFIHSSRTVIGLLLAAFLRFCALFSRFMGNLSRYIGKSLVKLYDLVIFLPLWVENIVLRFEAKHEKKDKEVQNEQEIKEAPKKTTAKRARKTAVKKEDNIEMQKDES
jgi:predicted kinase